MKKAIVPLILIFLVLLISVMGLSYYRILNNPPGDSPKGEYQFEVESGDVLSDVAEHLYKDKVIASPQALRFAQIRVGVEPLQTGVYTLKVPANSESILNQVNQQSREKKDANVNAGNIPSKKITIREGLTLDQVADLLAKEGVVDKAKFLSLANSPETFRTQYEFLPEPLTCGYGDLTNCAQYYLEGYLYPDTYTFVIGGSEQTVIEQMLDNFNAKVYKNVSGKVSPNELYKLLTLSSVIERETGRTKGVTETTAPELNQERRIMAQVFINRIAQGMKWQSDPTITYGTGLTACQQTFELKDCVLLDDPRVQTKYNTYLISGYPIGPVTSPQWAVINAALDPEPNDYLFFVSDVTGKKYFAKNESEHLKNIEFVTDLNAKISR